MTEKIDHTPEFSSSQFHEGSYLVYFNGIEIPATGVEVRMGVWQVPTATVTVAPDNQLTGLGREDRLHVAIFFLDQIYTNSGAADFRLLFEGEIIGWSYSNSPRGRSMSFDCISHLAILDEIYPYFMTGMDSILTAVMQRTQPNAMVFSHPGMTFPASLFYQGMDPTKDPIIRPYDFVENILQACVDTGMQKNLGSTVATNFYSRYIRRTNMINKWIPSPLIEGIVENRGIFPVIRALQSLSLVNAMAKKAMDFGNGNSVWATLQKIFLMVYYEILAITTPSMAQVCADPSLAIKGDVLGPPKWQASYDPASAAKQASKNVSNANASGPIEAMSSVFTPFPKATTPNRLLEYVTKPQWMMGVPPMCNVMFPSMIQELSFSENYQATPTRVGVNDESIASYFNPGGSTAAFAVLRGGHPVEYQNELNRKFGEKGAKGNVLLSGKNFLLWPEEFFRGPRISQELLPDWFTYLDDCLATEHKDTPETLWEKRQMLMTSYAHYEYERQRGSARRGGVTLVFNPYIVPGFPGMLFSDVATGQNYHVYITSVTHSMTKGGCQTSAGFTYAQTLDELMQEVAAARKEAAASSDAELKAIADEILAAPLNPIKEVRNVTQLLTNAEAYFSMLFHQKQAYATSKLRRAAADYRQMFDMVLASGDRVPLTNDQSATDNLSRYTGVVPSANFETCFYDPDTALRQISRPICTLEEYISFHRNGVRWNRVDAYDAQQGKGGTFYETILYFEQGPGDPPNFDQNNNLTQEFTADTRADWTTRLRNYRNKVIFDTAPHEA